MEGQNMASNACLNAISRTRVLRDFEKEEACGRCTLSGGSREFA
jgi:hypothetical protein